MVLASDPLMREMEGTTSDMLPTGDHVSDTAEGWHATASRSPLLLSQDTARIYSEWVKTNHKVKD